MSGLASKVDRKKSYARSRNGSRRYEISVRKTNVHFYADVYDTVEKNIVFTKSTLSVEKLKKTWDIDAAKEVAKLVVEELKSRKIDSIYFNKLCYKYHGKLSAFVEVLRESRFQI
jgi:large subunit ribosomal protein L18